MSTVARLIFSTVALLAAVIAWEVIDSARTQAALVEYLHLEVDTHEMCDVYPDEDLIVSRVVVLDARATYETARRAVREVCGYA